MNIELHNIKIADLIEGYINSSEEGVRGYGGRLDIRPKYQREFIYKEAQEQAVINSVLNGFPLNTFYWAKNGDAAFEVLDGQQRTMSVCRFCSDAFAIGNRFFSNLTESERADILGYELMVYFCEGTDKEKLEWFKVVNITGEKLTEQELRNAVYSGPWLDAAKGFFSKSACPAFNLASKYLKGAPLRQDYLERALAWIADSDSKYGGSIEKYMALHQNEQNANELWMHFNAVISWASLTFTTYRAEMKGVDWGFLYNKFGGAAFNTAELEEKISRLMQDDDVTKKSGIYWYVLDSEERHLSIRAFTSSMKREAYERQGGVCPRCKRRFAFEEMEGDHITPWSQGGKTLAENCQMLCLECNRRKGSI